MSQLPEDAIHLGDLILDSDDLGLPDLMLELQRLKDNLLVSLCIDMSFFDNIEICDPGGSSGGGGGSGSGSGWGSGGNYSGGGSYTSGEGGSYIEESGVGPAIGDEDFFDDVVSGDQNGMSLYDRALQTYRENYDPESIGRALRDQDDFAAFLDEYAKNNPPGERTGRFKRRYNRRRRRRAGPKRRRSRRARRRRAGPQGRKINYDPDQPWSEDPTAFSQEYYRRQAAMGGRKARAAKNSIRRTATAAQAQRTLNRIKTVRQRQAAQAQREAISMAKIKARNAAKLKSLTAQQRANFLLDRGGSRAKNILAAAPWILAAMLSQSKKQKAKAKSSQATGIKRQRKSAAEAAYSRYISQIRKRWRNFDYLNSAESYALSEYLRAQGKSLEEMTARRDRAATNRYMSQLRAKLKNTGELSPNEIYDMNAVYYGTGKKTPLERLQRRQQLAYERSMRDMGRQFKHFDDLSSNDEYMLDQFYRSRGTSLEAVRSRRDKASLNRYMKSISDKLKRGETLSSGEIFTMNEVFHSMGKLTPLERLQRRQMRDYNRYIADLKRRWRSPEGVGESLNPNEIYALREYYRSQGKDFDLISMRRAEAASNRYLKSIRDKIRRGEDLTPNEIYDLNNYYHAFGKLTPLERQERRQAAAYNRYMRELHAQQRARDRQNALLRSRKARATQHLSLAQRVAQRTPYEPDSYYMSQDDLNAYYMNGEELAEFYEGQENPFARKKKKKQSDLSLFRKSAGAAINLMTHGVGGAVLGIGGLGAAGLILSAPGIVLKLGQVGINIAEGVTAALEMTPLEFEASVATWLTGTATNVVTAIHEGEVAISPFLEKGLEAVHSLMQTPVETVAETIAGNAVETAQFAATVAQHEAGKAKVILSHMLPAIHNTIEQDYEEAQDWAQPWEDRIRAMITPSEADQRVAADIWRRAKIDTTNTIHRAEDIGSSVRDSIMSTLRRMQ